MKLRNFVSISAFLTLTPLLLSAETKPVNPNFQYVADGRPVSSWNIVVGDNSNWFQTISETGHSAENKVVIDYTDYHDKNDALRLKWTTKSQSQGNFGLYGWGTPLDLSAYQDILELAIVIRVDKRPDKEVNLGMACGDKCNGEVKFTNALIKLPIHEWTAYAVPLNCFVKNKLDPKKINGPFTLSTQGKLEISIADVRLEKMPEGEKGCTAEEPKK